MHKFIQTILLLVCFVFATNTQAQIINIPDANFKAKLLQSTSSNEIAKDSSGNRIKIDVNNDGQIQQSEALLVYKLVLSNNGIASMNGIEYFTNLKYLNCSSNLLTTINEIDLTNLLELNCRNNKLTSLNLSNFRMLENLDCSYNNLTTLNGSGLTNLKEFWCTNNNLLTSLNLSGCTNLFTLHCEINSLSTLSLSGCTNLIALDCEENQLQNLSVSGFTELKTIYCDNNQLQTLDFIGCTNLESIYCYNNRLQTLDVSDCSILRTLDCRGNILSSLIVNGLTNLEWLQCSNNQLSSLNVDGLTKLKTLDCGNNQLPSINVLSLTNLEGLYCPYNQLTFLSVYNLTNLKYLHVNNNNKLTYINLKNGICDSFYINHTDGIYYILHNNPNLRFICADDSDINTLKQNLISANLYNVTINSFCSSTLSGSYYDLNATIKLDLDNDGCTSQDANYPNLKIKIKNATDSGFAYSDVQGNFAIPFDIGSYTLIQQLPNSYFICSPTSTTITLPEDTIPQQFCITPNGIHHDVSITVIPVRAARPGFSDAKYKIVLKNKGNQIENGTLLFNYDENKQDFISASSTPNSITSGQLAFVFSNLQPFVTREITVTMRNNAPTDNPAVNTGDVIQLSVTANLDNGVRDEFFKDNFQNIKQTVIGSFDPNDKTCLEGDIITPILVGDFVNYLIRFENTGTANAENIVVTDFIDLNTFDISTLEITSTSHNCKTLIRNGNKVQFVFDNINLPFTEPLKYGYVAFKIKLRDDLTIGDSLKNHADIYFDYNLPITTNTATSRIETVTAIKYNSKKEGSLSVYPNPGNGNFTVNFESEGNNPILISVSDINGKTVYEQKTVHHNRSSTSIELQNLPNGMYQLQIFSDKDVWIQKLLLVK